MASQAFFYNAIFFTYALMLTRFYGIPEERVGYYILPFALGNFLGPLALGRLFDVVGREKDDRADVFHFRRSSDCDGVCVLARLGSPPAGRRCAGR
jgi:hypothetical protein